MYPVAIFGDLQFSFLVGELLNSKKQFSSPQGVLKYIIYSVQRKKYVILSHLRGKKEYKA